MTDTTTDHKVTRNSSSVVTLKMNIEGTVSDWEQWVLVQSDEHWDNAKCDRKLLKSHMDEAVRRDAWIVKLGDLFCVMQGRYDKRQSRAALRPEHAKGDDYFTLLKQTAADWFQPYAHHMLCVGQGNHETAIIKKYGTDLIGETMAVINDREGSNIQTMGYGYWIRFQFQYNGTRRQIVKLKAFHGSGGGGPVTRGVISTNRMAVYLPDADIVVCGHTHDAYVVPIRRERLSHDGQQKHDTQWHMRTPTYKDEYGDGSGGWHIERGGAPKPLGSFWIRFFYEPSEKNIQFEIIPYLKY